MQTYKILNGVRDETKRDSFCGILSAICVNLGTFAVITHILIMYMHIFKIQIIKNTYNII